jgi:hypothetical protein
MPKFATHLDLGKGIIFTQENAGYFSNIAGPVLSLPVNLVMTYDCVLKSHF